MNRVYEELPCAAKINMSFGYVLQNIEYDEKSNVEQKYRYFYAHDNETVYERPVFVGDKTHLAFLTDQLADEDLFSNVRMQRPSTKWRFHMITNVTIKATLMKDVPLGGRTDLPMFLLDRRDLFILLYN